MRRSSSKKITRTGRALCSFIIIFFVLAPMLPAQASVASRLSGRILLDVERNGEAWYVYPDNLKRYYLGRPADAFSVMRQLGLGITEIDFQRLSQAGMDVDGDLALANRLAGKIILQVEKNGEAWYINPLDLKKYYLGRPADAFSLMRQLGLGIKRSELALIHKPGTEESIDNYSRYENRSINIITGSFTFDMITIDLDDPDLKIITASVSPLPGDFDRNANQSYGARPLADFVLSVNAFAGINGTYFDTGAAKTNYYFFPVYDSLSEKLINEDQLKYWTTGPIMAWDNKNKFYYFKDSRDFQSVKAFEEKYGVKLQAALGNKPRLVEEGMNMLIEWDIDEKQRLLKTLRNSIGYKQNKIYLVIARNATVPDLAEIMKALGMEYALNLDGGYSSALWYNDEYMVKPGRNIPNALLFGKK